MNNWIIRFALAGWCSPPLNSGRGTSAEARPSRPSKSARTTAPKPPPRVRRKRDDGAGYPKDSVPTADRSMQHLN